MKNGRTNRKRKKIIKHRGNATSLAVVSFSLMTFPISAAVDSSDIANQIMGSGGRVTGMKSAIGVALKVVF